MKLINVLLSTVVALVGLGVILLMNPFVLALISIFMILKYGKI